MRWLRWPTAVVVVGVTAAALADVAVGTLSAVDRVTYVPSFHGALWITPATQAPRSWFRLSFGLDRRPDAVALLLDVEQTYTLYVNGVLVGDDKPDLAAGVSQTHLVDLTGMAAPGENVVGVRVVNGDHRAAALRARLTIVEGGNRTDLLSGSPVARWRATSDVAAVETPGLGPTSFPWPAETGTGGVRLVPGETIVPGSVRDLGQNRASAPQHHSPTTLLPPGQMGSRPAPTASGPNTALQNAIVGLGGLSTALGGGLIGGSGPSGTPGQGSGVSLVPGGEGRPYSALPPGPATPAPAATPAARAAVAGAIPVTTGLSPRLLTQVDAGYFSIPGFADPSWAPAVAVEAPRGDVAAPLPAWVVDEPLRASVISAPGATSLLAVFATVTLPQGAVDGWIRVAAQGTAGVYLNGAPVVPAVGVLAAPTDAFSGAGTTGPDVWQQRSPPRTVPRRSTGLRALVPYVSAYHLGPLFRPGRNVLSVIVTADTQPSVYVDGHLQTPSGSVALRSSRLWTARTGPGSVGDPPRLPAQDVGSVLVAWGNRPPVIPIDSGVIARPEGMLWGPRLGATAGVVGVWLLAALVVRCWRRRSLGDLLAAGAWGCIPGLVLVEITGELARLPSFRAPGLRVWQTVAALYGAIVLGVVVAIASISRRPQRRTRRRSPAVEACQLLRRWRRRLAGGVTGWRSLPRPKPLPAAVSLGPQAGGAVLLPTSPWWGWRLAARSPTGAVAEPLPVGADVQSTLVGLFARLRSLGTTVVRYWSQLTVGAIAVTVAAINAYRLDYEPFWQDELFSLAGARGIRAHVLPIWPSGFQYWKGELYSLTIAAVGRLFGDTPATLRLVSVVLYGATVAAFGLLLVPEVLGRGRRWLQVGVTALFATAPAEMSWAREARMYQMADLFMVCFLALYLRALHRPTTRNLAAATVSLLAMYFSHEETFIALPAVVLVGVLSLRLQLLRDRRWLAFAAAAFALIGGQALLAFSVQPQWFGYDHSNRPYIGFDTTDAWYYLSNVFFQGNGGLALVSTLAFVGSIVGLWRRSLERNLLTCFLWVEVFMLSVVFAPRIPRYTFIVLPPLLLLAALGAEDLIQGARRVLTPADGRGRRSPATGRLAAVTMALGVVWLAVSQPASVESYGLAVSQLTRSPTQMRYVDFPYVVDYMRRHWRPGDLFVAAAPPNIAAEYFGRPPDNVIQTRANDRFFYMFEKGGKAVDTEFGAEVVLAPTDLQRLLETHRRIWLVTDDGRYLSTLPPGFIDLINTHFVKVSEGATSALYVGYG